MDIHDLVHLRLLGTVEFLETDREMDFASIRQQDGFAPLAPADLNQGITGRTFWLRLQLSNRHGNAAKHWILHHETSYLDNLAIWYADDGGAFQQLVLSDREVFSARSLEYRKLGLRHATPAGGYTDVYLQLSYSKPDSLSLGFHLWDESEFHGAVADSSLLYGVYFGMMLAFITIALVCAMVLRHLMYLHYAAFLFCNALLWAVLGGFAFQYLWPGLPFLHNEGIHIVFLLTALTAFQFSKKFLSTRDLLPRMHRAVSLVQLAAVAAVGMRLAGLYTSVLVMAYAFIATLSLLPILGWMAYRRGIRHARWYTGAWAVYSACLLLSIVSAVGVFSIWGMDPLIYAQVGSLLEALLLLVALGDRLVGWDRERKTALLLAHRDPLTGLGNRRRLTQVFDERDPLLTAGTTSTFVAMIDLDHFKEINDTYGHDAGDRVLQDLARLLLRHTRADDVCARYGGEEFAVLLRVPSLADAHHVIERVRQEFATTPTRCADQLIDHTFSAGLVQVGDGAKRPSLGEMMAKADAALYQAKARGRNQTVVLGELGV